MTMLTVIPWVLMKNTLIFFHWDDKKITFFMILCISIFPVKKIKNFRHQRYLLVINILYVSVEQFQK